MKKRYKCLIGLGLVITGLYLGNASWIMGPPEGEMSVLSHRGVHQTYHRRGLNNETCTAERIDPPTHDFLENTIDSIAAAKVSGADFIELDVHLTADGEFVVFHDWTVDCRTDGTGRTIDLELAYLKSLDIGYGYTADGGNSFPFRGQFKGAMPTLQEVLKEFPDINFVVNMKTRAQKDARAMLEYLGEDQWEDLSFVSHPDVLEILRAQRPDNIYVSRRAIKSCMKSYMLTGWSGYVPEDCHNMHVYVPANYRRFIWGWPHRFERRLNSVGSRSVLMGDLGDHLASGMDTRADIDRVPNNYKGMVYTNKVEVIGPALKSLQNE